MALISRGHSESSQAVASGEGSDGDKCAAKYNDMRAASTVIFCRLIIEDGLEQALGWE